MSKTMRINKNRFSVRASLFTLTVDIEGVIGVAEQEQFDSEDERIATYEKFRRALHRIENSKTRRIVVNIRSTGGDLGDALLIYEALRASGCEVTTRCYGYVASAATIIAQAAAVGHREVASSALYLIHRCHGQYAGNVEELEEARNLLSESDQRVAEIYAERSGRSVAEVLDLMGANSGRGRWLSPDEVVAFGLADKVIGQKIDKLGRSAVGPAAAHFDPSLHNLPPLPEMVGTATSDNRSALPEMVGTATDSARSALPEMVGGEPDATQNSRSHLANMFAVERAAGTYGSVGGFERARPTMVEPTEDPSLAERQLSANELAYRNDARTISDR